MYLHSIKTAALETLKEKRNLFQIGAVNLQVYKFNYKESLTILFSLEGRPQMKMLFLPDNLVKIYFPKPHIPTEIGYDAIECSDSETIDILKSSTVLSQYPAAGTLYKAFTLDSSGEIK